MNHVRRYLPPFGIVYTGSETGRKLFSDQKIPVTKISMYNPEVNSGTEIRRRIIENENWKALVPNIIVDFIDEIDGVKRLQSLNY